LLAAVDLRLRAATLEDAAVLLAWTNDPAARAASVQTAPVPWETHCAWLRARLNTHAHAIFILEGGGRPLGTVRFTAEPGRWRLSYSLDPAARGQGLGRALVQRGLRALTGRGPDLVLAEVKPDNLASLHTFRRLGWSEAPPTAAHPLHQFTTARPPGPEPT
jgi:RimJ/RimL family protein N-acetyltransferase